MKKIYYASSEVLVSYEDAFDMVVIADNEMEARQVAAEAEENNDWLDRMKSTFEKIGNAPKKAESRIVVAAIK